MAFDLSNRRMADTNELNIIDPLSGDDTGWVITFAGPGHEKAVKQVNRMISKGLKKSRTKGGAASFSVEEIKEQGVDFIVERIIDWEGLVDGGKEIEFDEDIAKKLLAEPELSWARKQCDQFLADDASFIKRSVKN